MKCETKSAIQMFLEDSERSNIVEKLGFAFFFYLLCKDKVIGSERLGSSIAS